MFSASIEPCGGWCIGHIVLLGPIERNFCPTQLGQAGAEVAEGSSGLIWRRSRGWPPAFPLTMDRLTSNFLRWPESLVSWGGAYPITYNGLKSAWKRIRAAAGVTDFRFHDYRYDFATKLLRETRNLKLVQKALNHADIKTTTKYAHIVDDEVVAGLDAMQKFRRKSRKSDRKVS
jgi:hypothetical protein